MPAVLSPLNLVADCLQTGQASAATTCVIVLQDHAGRFMLRYGSARATMPLSEVIGLLRQAQLACEVDLQQVWQQGAAPITGKVVGA